MALTTCIKHLAVSGLSSVSARIKSSCNLTGNRFEMPNVSYTQPLCSIVDALSIVVMQEKRDNILTINSYLSTLND